MSKVKILSISHYVQSALKLAQYAADENGVIVARVRWTNLRWTAYEIG
jgi:hypothetical protein